MLSKVDKVGLLVTALTIPLKKSARNFCNGTCLHCASIHNSRIHLLQYIAMTSSPGPCPAICHFYVRKRSAMFGACGKILGMRLQRSEGDITPSPSSPLLFSLFSPPHPSPLHLPSLRSPHPSQLSSHRDSPISQHHTSLTLLYCSPKGGLLCHSIRATVVEQGWKASQVSLVPAGDQTPLHGLDHPLTCVVFILLGSTLCCFLEVGMGAREKDGTVDG